MTDFMHRRSPRLHPTPTTIASSRLHPRHQSDSHSTVSPPPPPPPAPSNHPTLSLENMATHIPTRRFSPRLHSNHQPHPSSQTILMPTLHPNCLASPPNTLLDSKPQHSHFNTTMSPTLHTYITPAASTHQNLPKDFNHSIRTSVTMTAEIGRRFSPRLHSNTPTKHQPEASSKTILTPTFSDNNRLTSLTFPDLPLSSKTPLDSKPLTPHGIPQHSDLTRRMSPRLHRNTTPGSSTHEEIHGVSDVSLGVTPHVSQNMATEIGRRFSPRLHSNTPNKDQEDASKESVFQRRLSPRLHPDKNKEKLNPLLKSCAPGKRLRHDFHPRSNNVAKKNKLQHHPEASTESTQLHSFGTVGDPNVVPLHSSTSGVQMLNKIAQSDGSTLDTSGRNFHAKIKETLRIFNTYYLQFVQEEADRIKQRECEKAKSETSKFKEKRGKQKLKGKWTIFRADLKALTRMIKNKETLNREMIIGHVPGVDVGHQFYSRAEMAVVGLHNHWLNGIVYVGSYGSEKRNFEQYTLPIALSVVMSGQYEDDLDNLEEVIYTGQGRHDLVGSKLLRKDQKLVRGNLALKNSMDQSIPIRVIRARDNPDSYSGKIYSYDGLYKVMETLSNRGCREHLVYRYLLKRLPGQPKLTTGQVEFVRGFPPKTSSELPGLIHHDITNGQEDICIPVTNICDDPPLGPAGFTYIKTMEVHESVKLPLEGTGCKCKGNCTNPSACACAKLNGSDFPYVRHRGGGRLHEPKDIVFECGPNCGCGPDCLNRTSQRGIKYHLEVYRTPDKGWAVRSQDFIPSGAPVCEYIGVLSRSDELDNVAENDYIFEIDCLHTMNEIEGRERRFGSLPVAATNVLPKLDKKTLDCPPEFSIDAGSRGNVARFINHSCEPNLFVQCILSTHHDFRLARLVLFAAEDIFPMQELTYDYGYALDSVVGADGKVQVLPCFCGTSECRKRLH